MGGRSLLTAQSSLIKAVYGAVAWRWPWAATKKLRHSPLLILSFIEAPTVTDAYELICLLH